MIHLWRDYTAHKSKLVYTVGLPISLTRAIALYTEKMRPFWTYFGPDLSIVICSNLCLNAHVSLFKVRSSKRLPQTYIHDSSLSIRLVPAPSPIFVTGTRCSMMMNGMLMMAASGMNSPSYAASSLGVWQDCCQPVSTAQERMRSQTGCHGSHSASSCSVATASGENYSDRVSLITCLKFTKLLKCLFLLSLSMVQSPKLSAV